MANWLDGLSTALTAGTKGASGWLQGQQRGRKEAEDRAKEIAAMLRQKRLDEQNALMQNAQMSHLAKQTELMGVPKPAEGFTLAPRARRYDAEGKLLAEGAPDEPQGINPYQERVLAQGDARLKLAREAAARAGQGGGASRPPTDSQRKAQALLMTAEQANNLLRGFGTGKAPPSWLNQQASKVGIGVGNVLSPGEYQRMKQAALQLSDAWLRYTSGAAVPESEVERFAQSFLPVAGDKPATLVQKLKARETVIKAMRMGAGSATPDAAAVVQDFILPNDRED